MRYSLLEKTVVVVSVTKHPGRDRTNLLVRSSRSPPTESVTNTHFRPLKVLVYEESNNIQKPVKGQKLSKKGEISTKPPSPKQSEFGSTVLRFQG